MNKLNTTLLLIIQNKKILLAEKKRGFGVNKINGFGGKQKPGETIIETMIRETKEEAGIIPLTYKQVGKITYDMWYKGENTIEQMNIFVCDKFFGKEIETDEMKPIWFDIDKIPYDKMFENDKCWLPLVINGKKIIGDCKFDKDFNEIYKNIKVVDEEFDFI